MEATTRASPPSFSPAPAPQVHKPKGRLWGPEALPKEAPRIIPPPPSPRPLPRSPSRSRDPDPSATLTAGVQQLAPLEAAPCQAVPPPPKPKCSPHGGGTATSRPGKLPAKPKPPPSPPVCPRLTAWHRRRLWRGRSWQRWWVPEVPSLPRPSTFRRFFWILMRLPRCWPRTDYAFSYGRMRYDVVKLLADPASGPKALRENHGISDSEGAADGNGAVRRCAGGLPYLPPQAGRAHLD